MIIAIDGNEANVKNRVGSGVYAFEIIKHLYQIDNKNSYKIFLKEKPIADFPPTRVDWQYLVFGPKKFWTQAALPIKLLTTKPKPDVFFTPGHYAPRFSKIPQVVTIFDLSFIRFPKMFRKKDLYQLINWTKYSVNKAKAILTISNFSKQEIVDYYQIDPKNVYVIYPGYDQTLFKPIKDQKLISAVKRKYKIKRDYLLFVGTIQPRKNLIKLIEAFKLVISDQRLVTNEKKDNHQLPISNDLQLLIVGKKGWLYDDFFAKVQQMQDKIIICDFVDNKDLPIFYSGAKAFVFPSLYEGFGIPVVEAMASGCPVIVANSSSLPEVVDDSGILIDPNSERDIKDAIEKIINNAGFAENLIKKGLIYARKFSWTECAKKTVKILEKTL